MLPLLEGDFGDPGRLHAEGRTVRVLLEQAREQVAACFGARAREVTFASSGTEAVNAALHWAHGHVVTTAVEHSSVREALARAATDVTVVGVDGYGRFAADEVIGAVRADTTVVSVQLANHEVGTLQPAAEVCAALRGRGGDVRVHVDACAAAGHVPLSFAALGADLCSVASETFGGPLGAGALLVRRGVRVPPLLVGGAQERARRAGIENVPAWVGFGAACADVDIAREADTQRALIEIAAAGAGTVPGIERLGATGDGTLPHVLCLGIAGVEAEPVLLALDQHGVAVHSGSACSSEALEPSPVLAAMGADADRSLRVSVGWSSVRADVDRFVGAFGGIVERLRGLRTP